MDNKAKILDIAMNLNRIGNWAADDYQLKQKRIALFLDQTDRYINDLNTASFENPFRKTLVRFLEVYKQLQKEEKSGPKDRLYWAELMMTWGNILTHRASLIRS